MIGICFEHKMHSRKAHGREKKRGHRMEQEGRTVYRKLVLFS